MLAKQCWRLLNHSNSLVTEIIKARYYPDTTILEAQLGNNPSYIWRSLMEALDVLKSGVRRQIGTGEDTKVWHIPWLPDAENGYLTTPMQEYLQDIRVKNLMDMTGKAWDSEVIDDLFNTRDAALIKRIPIPRIDKVDAWFWLLDNDGLFTVKSAYRKLQGELEVTQKEFWKKLWSLKMPGKVTHFIWRVCNGCLPTTEALSVKRVIQNANCPWCLSTIETDTHVLFECGFACTVWQITGLHQQVSTTPQDTAFDVFCRVFAQGSREQCVRVSMLAWALWNRRNKWIWDHVNGSASGVNKVAAFYLKDWREAQDAHIQLGDRLWTKPMDGWVKLNTDAAVFQDGSIGVGCVLRNDQGQFLGARHCRIVGAWSPREAEAIGMKEALAWLLERGCERCIIESDSQVLVTACKGQPGEAMFGTLVGDCIQMLKHINLVLVKFVYRSANKVAHVLAQATYSMSGVREWGEHPPAFISSVLERDL